MDWLDLLAVQGTLKSLLQHHSSSKASILQCSAFFTVQLSYPYMTTGKTIALTRRTFGGKVMSLLLNMLDMLSHSSHVQLCVTPRTAAHQALLSLGFSRQEQWSGLPFPSPTFENGKWKWSRSVLSDSSQPHGLKPTRLLRPWDFPGKSTGVGCHFLHQC